MRLASAALITWIISQVSEVIGGRIDLAEAARNAAQQELLALNAELEERVQRRTQQLREKNQQMEEELQMARELQIALLPQQFPTVPPNVSAQEKRLAFPQVCTFLPVTSAAISSVFFPSAKRPPVC